MSSSKTLWLGQITAISEKRAAALEMYGPLLSQEPWAKDALERQLTRSSAEEALMWGMYDDLEVLVRKSAGAPKTVYHCADRPCGRALLRGFRRMLEDQARAKHLTRCPSCSWPADRDSRASA